LVSGAAAAAAGVLGRLAGFSGGGVIAAGLGRLAEAEASGVGGLAGVGAGGVAGALTSIAWTGGAAAGFGAITAVATGNRMRNCRL
jgi:hypothetical protein